MRWLFRFRQFSVSSSAMLKSRPTIAAKLAPPPSPLRMDNSDPASLLQKWFPKSKVEEKKAREKSKFVIELVLITKNGQNNELKPLAGKGIGTTLTEARILARESLINACLEYQKRIAESKPANLIGLSDSHPEVTSLFNEEITADKAGTFVKTFFHTWGGGVLKEELVCKNETFYCSLSATISAEHLNERGRQLGITTGCGIGAYRIKAKARSMAKIDLVKRIAAYIKGSEHCFKGRPLDAAALVDNSADAEIKHFLVDFPADIISDANGVFKTIQESGMFEQAIKTTSEATGNMRFSSKQYPSYSQEQLDLIPSLPVPDSFGKTRHLPIFERYQEILQTVESNQVTVLSAATGSGKTTQVPQFILSLYEALRPSMPDSVSAPSVICTQPRRIAAISVAQRIAAERGETMTSDCSVGYLVRFQSQFPAGPKSYLNGRILMCTSGILLKKLQSNPDLTDVSHVIIDEVHERDVFSDILLMLSKGILKRRPGLKVILMSATLESDKYAEYFAKDGFKVGRVDDIGGTNYPVESVYLDELCKQLRAENYFPATTMPETDKYLSAERDPSTISLDPIIRSNDLTEVPIDIVGETVGWLHRTKPPGAILVFLPGWDEIVSVQEYLTKSNHLTNSPPHKLFVLHSNGPQQVTDDLFYRTPEYRKIILATNIAESSITIPDAVYVVDSGKQKTTFYDAKHRMNVLETCWLSRSNLKQRMGRAGRCQAGTYYSLMSRSRADALPSHVPPELARLNLDEVCLGVRASGVTEPCEDFLARALDPPSSRAVKESVKELQAIQAFNEQQQMTPLGRLLANIPIHPRTSKMLVTATLLKCVTPVESMVAAMGEKLTKSTLMMESKLALNAYLRRIGENLYSDHLAILKVFNDWCRGDRSMCSVFSDHGFGRMNKSKHSIHSPLSKAMFDQSVNVTEYDRNATDKNLLRFVLLSGFYPDLAKMGRRRNTVHLAHIKSPVLLAQTSVNALPPAPNYEEPSRAKARQIEMRRQLAAMPSMFIYEDLFDAGTKRVQKTTAIDPMWAALFCESLVVKPFPKTKTCLLIMDNWIVLEGPTEAISLLTELRHHYGNFIQFAVSKQLVGQSLTDEEQRLADSFVELIVRLVSKHTDIRRKLE